MSLEPNFQISIPVLQIFRHPELPTWDIHKLLFCDISNMMCVLAKSTPVPKLCPLSISPYVSE